MTTRNKNISLRIATEATVKLIAEEKPDALILAIGGSPVIPKLTYQNASRVIWVGDVDAGNVRIGDKVLVAGAGLTGCEAALRFVQSGKSVTLIDSLPREELGSGSSAINAYSLFNILAESAVELRTRTELIDVTEDHIIVASGGTKEELVYDTVVLSLGTRVDTEAINQLRAAAAECYVVGNSNERSGTVWNATTSAFDAAMAV
jgi:NADPH-dependent 2,4-dienoyl-CoA reductase/sulfur reductase-like enzyme